MNFVSAIVSLNIIKLYFYILNLIICKFIDLNDILLFNIFTFNLLPVGILSRFGGGRVLDSIVIY